MKKLITGAVLLVLFTSAGVAFAFHAWGPYHWARTVNPFTLKIGDSVYGTLWDNALLTAAGDWDASSVLNTEILPGQLIKSCKGVNGRVEVCNAKYGNNGWLGLAQIWITGGEHITKGVVKLNDTYFNTAAYNTAAWRNLVVCQEIGHTLGLDHQDENFKNPNLGTCMDYTDNPETNQHPNTHDYEQLMLMYGHTDSFTTILSGTLGGQGKKGVGAENANTHAEFGTVVRRDGSGRPSLYGRDLGNGEKLFTFIYWAK